MSWEPGTPNTGSVLATMSDASVRVLWQQTADVFDQQEDFMGQFEGNSMTNPVALLEQMGGKEGLKFRITSRGGYYNVGKSGEDLFLDEDDFAREVINNNEVTADFLRNAASASDRTDEFMGMRNEIASGQAAELGKWMGRERTARALMTFRELGGTENLFYAGDKTSEANLVAADGLSYDELVKMGQALKPMGGTPAEVATINGNPVYKYLVVGTVPGLYSLRTDSDYKQILRETINGPRYDENPMLRGGYVDIEGHRIHEFNPIRADGYGWSGSAMNPVAYLGTAIAAGTAALSVTGGGSAAAAAVNNIEFFRFFSGHDFEFTPASKVTAATTTQYFLIINPRGATTVANPYPGKIGMYSYTTGNTGKVIGTVTRLTSVQNGPYALNTVGSVTYNGGVWSGLHTEVHPIGSTIVQCNAKGQPIGDTLMLGSAALLRGYGSERNKREQWRVDAFVTRKYIMGIFGQALRKNVNGQYPGYVRLRHAVAYPELGLPTVV